MLLCVLNLADSGEDTDKIQGLTVCGHTLGSVHHGGFPQVGE
jgi:hypothetical protein